MKKLLNFQTLSKYKLEYTQQLIYVWINKNLKDCKDPKAFGKGLTLNRSGQWKYKIGDYRIIADIQDEKVTILLLEQDIEEVYMIKK